MTETAQSKVRIVHVLTMDLIGYSTLLLPQQSEALAELNRIVRETAPFRNAGEGKLLRLPTGDGMVLVFFDEPEAPLECAVEIDRALKTHPELRLRMGIHSGPVNEILDINDRSNIAGAGIDLAQRVMDCGDAGHILLSKRVADDLAPHPKWNPHLHELGEYEVKHGRRIALVNFYTEEVGNDATPTKCLDAAAQRPNESIASVSGRSGRRRALAAGAALLLVALTGGALLHFRPGNPAPGAADKATPVDRHSIAVLPFENAANDPNAEYLAEGIAEALINSLTELQQLKVIARSTAFHYKGPDVDPKRVGRELQVGAVLTGRVRQVQDALSIQVDLVDATTGTQLWGSAFERKISDVIAVKQAIAREVAEALKLRLSGEDQRRLVKRDSTNPVAYQAYLRGRYYWNRRTPEGTKKAIEEFGQAIALDPDFALGYAGLADSFLLLEQYSGVPSQEFLPKARAAADRALQIDPSLAEAHTSSAMIYQFMWQWAQAKEGFHRAIALNPNYPTGHHWYALSLVVDQRLDEALAEIKRAQELDPLSPIIGSVVAMVYVVKNEPEPAIEQCQRIIELYPNHPAGHDWLGLAYLRQGRIKEAIAVREKVVELSQRSTPQLGLLGYLYAIGGRKPEAIKIRDDLEQRYAKRESVGQTIAAVCFGLGEKAEGFAWLEKDFQQHSAELQFVRSRLQFDNLRDDPRYIDLIRRMGLTP